jgi:hypothetical protein
LRTGIWRPERLVGVVDDHTIPTPGQVIDARKVADLALGIEPSCSQREERILTWPADNRVHITRVDGGIRI